MKKDMSYNFSAHVFFAVRARFWDSSFDADERFLAVGAAVIKHILQQSQKKSPDGQIAEHFS